MSFFLASCGATSGAEHISSLLSSHPTLVVLGDSIAAGQYLPDSSDAFPYLLTAELHAQLTVYAVAGHTAAETRSMYSGELDPTYAVIELGTNDYNHSVPLATFAATYRSVVMSIAPTTRVLCLSLWDPINSKDSIWSSPFHIPASVNQVGASPAAYNAIIMQLCRGRYLSIQSIYETVSYHGIGSAGPLYHPNVAGNAAIAQEIDALFSSSS